MDTCLNDIAKRACEANATLGILGYIKQNCFDAAHDYSKNRECGWAQENHGGAFGSADIWKDRIRRPVCLMMHEAKGTGHRANIESAEWKRLGTGTSYTATSADWCHEFGR